MMECESRSVWPQRLFFLRFHTVSQTCQVHLLLLNLFPAPSLSVLLGRDYPAVITEQLWDESPGCLHFNNLGGINSWSWSSSNTLLFCGTWPMQMHWVSSRLLVIPGQGQSYCSALAIGSSQLRLHNASLVKLPLQILETRSSIREGFCPYEF